MAEKPKASSDRGQRELDKAEAQFEAFDANVKQMTMDRMNTAPKEESEPTHGLSIRDQQKAKEIYLKPKRSLPPGVNPKTGEREKFNEEYRNEWNFKKEYVQFIAEHKEIIGEPINDIWTKPFPGVNCESWDVPTGKPVWGPRYLAEQIKGRNYHRLRMDQKVLTSEDGYGQMFGALTVDTTVQRLDANPVTQRKSVFMGANNF